MKKDTSLPAQGSLRELLEFMLRGSTREVRHLEWPPDVFALAASVLKATGAYVEVLSEWRPKGMNAAQWAGHARVVGRRWRQLDSVPEEVMKSWSAVASFPGRLSEVSRSKKTTAALLQLVAFADEACAGVGIAPEGALIDRLSIRAATNLIVDDTLCEQVLPSKARVLPKLHTPSGGLTIRSLTHHLALIVGNETEVKWDFLPRETKGKLNLLVVPWPLEMESKQFAPARERDGRAFLRHGLLSYHPREDPRRVRRTLEALLAQAGERGYRVDAVIYPELALTPKEYLAAQNVAFRAGAFLVGGVAHPPDGSSLARNAVRISSKLWGGTYENEQSKHHRWRLDGTQVKTYGLHWQLDSGRDWWEAIPLERSLVFLPLNPELTICCLVCEDLARQEPVAEIVRAVGPNLLIALLMDAPQLPARWPARYATVLADDPGTSVLTLTSAGMVDLSRPPSGGVPSRSVAMWKDSASGAVTMELPIGHQGILLSLWNDVAEERTVDGRLDGGVSVFPRLADWCSLPGSPENTTASGRAARRT